MPHKSSQREGDALARTALIVLVYLLEVTLMVFAGLTMFRVVAAENWWTLGINIAQIVVSSAVWYFIGREKTLIEALFLLVSLLSAAIMTVLRSVYQGVIHGEDAEEVSETSERDLKMTYIGLANTRTVIFVLLSALLLVYFMHKPVKRALLTTKP